MRLAFLLALAVGTGGPAAKPRPHETYGLFEKICSGNSFETVAAKAKSEGWTSFDPVGETPLNSLFGGMYGAMNAGHPDPVKKAFYFLERDGVRREAMALVDDQDLDGSPETLSCHVMDFEDAASPDEEQWTDWVGAHPKLEKPLQESSQQTNLWGDRKVLIWNGGQKSGTSNLVITHSKPNELTRSFGFSGLHIVTFTELVPTRTR